MLAMYGELTGEGPGGDRGKAVCSLAELSAATTASLAEQSHDIPDVDIDADSCLESIDSESSYSSEEPEPIVGCESTDRSEASSERARDAAPDCCGPESAEQAKMRKQVPPPSHADGCSTLPQPGPLPPVAAGERRLPNVALSNFLRGQTTDWERARKLVGRLLDPKYSLAEFFADLSAFPELQLYLPRTPDDDGDTTTKSAGTSSGRTACDEYQRTIGAFFAIYWLVRADIDGKEGFSFGVDEDWSTRMKVDIMDDEAKRIAFHELGSWGCFRQLLVDADIMRYDHEGRVELNEARLLGLLALTAFHDIMKITTFLPEVQPEHAPYHGYAAGDIIGDHDHALSYIMDFYPDLLPSFSGLPPAERKAVLFTQSKMQFNNGWFVQAEAPPGAIFAKLREALQHRGPVDPRDLALYFVHWLTDLAGAEPTPLGGCEKFATGFPVFVLNTFLRSFEFVKEAARKTETEVTEDYLKMRWVEGDPCNRPLPQGPDSIAKMRLLCMAQANASNVLQAFDDLPDADRQLLSAELSRSGCEGQHFSPTLAPPEAASGGPGAPAVLVYYGPAFLQKVGEDSAGQRLRLLAEVFRRARGLWPQECGPARGHVTVFIDAIKALSVEEIQSAAGSGAVWILVKRNECEAFLECTPQSRVEELVRSGVALQVLDCSMDS